ncbi:MAG: Hsp20/alpha crystallin family protein [Syntrophaceae bacterium]
MYNLKFQELIGLLLGPDSTEERIGVCYPSLDVYENSEELCVEVEIPGVNPNDVNVEMVGRTLMITGMKKDPLANKGVRYIRLERSFGKFTRELDIPERFNLEKVEARFVDGVLKIRVARADDGAKKIKKIEIE